MPSTSNLRRGRPPLSLSPATLEARKKQQTRDRVRLYRFHMRAKKVISSDIQRMQRDEVLSQASKGSSPSPTPLKLGLRLADLDLAEDPEQEQADDSRTYDSTAEIGSHDESNCSRGQSVEPAPTPTLDAKSPFGWSPTASRQDSESSDEFHDSLVGPQTGSSPAIDGRQHLASGIEHTPNEQLSPYLNDGSPSLTRPSFKRLQSSAPLSVGSPPNISPVSILGQSSHNLNHTKLKKEPLSPQLTLPSSRSTFPTFKTDRSPAPIPIGSPPNMSLVSNAGHRDLDQDPASSKQVSMSPQLTLPSSRSQQSLLSKRSASVSLGVEMPVTLEKRRKVSETPAPSGANQQALESIGDRIDALSAGLDENGDSLPDEPLDISYPSEPEPIRSDEQCRIRVAGKVIEQLTAFRGCGHSAHLRRQAQHMEEHEGEHVGLEAIWKHPLDRVDVLGQPNLLQDRKIPRAAPDPKHLREMITGISSESPTPPKICLHANEPTPSSVEVSFDCDSFLGFASSLAFARNGINFNPYPSATRNVKSDLHLGNQRPAEKANRDELPPSFDVRNTAHYHFGYVTDVPGLSVYIIFPHLPVNGPRFQGLTDQELTVWMDEAVFPAIARAGPADVGEKIPRSLKAAKLMASAPHVETRCTDGAQYRPTAAISHFLPSLLLGNVWEEINLETEKKAALRLYRDCQIFFSAKGVKQQHRIREGSLFDCITNFDVWFAEKLDLRYIFEDYLYIDIGKETICPYHYESLEAVDAAPRGRKPQVFFFRECCVQSYIDTMYEGLDRGVHTFFTPALLGQILNLTSVPNKGSTLARGGILFIQLYSSWKNIFDAIKVYPFASPGLEELALDPDIRQAAAKVARSTSHSIEHVVKAYLHSKARTDCVVRDARRISWSTRQEIRAAKKTVDVMRNELAPQAQMAVCGRLADAPPYICRIPTQSFCRFLWHNANKFAHVFEQVRSKYRHRRVPWDATGLMVMALRLLEHCVSASDLRREGALFWDRRENPDTGNSWQGLGFQTALRDYNYCWPKDLVNWKQLRWRAHCQTQMLFGNKALRRKYKSYSTQMDIKSFEADSQFIERLVRWLSRTSVVEKQGRILITIAHIVLRRLRCDILGKEPVPPDTDGRPRKPAAVIQRTDVFFCHDSLGKLYGKELAISGGNASEFKTLQKMVAFLFGDNDEWSDKRKHILLRPYRVLFFTASEEIERHYAIQNAREEWEKIFFNELVEYHWLFPCPNLSAKILSTRTERRQSVQWGGETQIRFWPTRRCDGKQPGDLFKWRYGGSKKGLNYQKGLPKPYPKELSWTTSDWKEYLSGASGDCNSSE
ncbi:MAG: hypothetical protein Q9218_003211 [Villophora microphyllina]